MLNNEQSKEALKPMTREEFRALITLGHADMKACKDEQRIRATLRTTLTGLSGEGSYEFTRIKGDPVDNGAMIRLKDNLREFDVEVKNEADAMSQRLKGRKL